MVKETPKTETVTEAPQVPDAPKVNRMPVRDERKKGLCPACNEDKVANEVIRTRHAWQCLQCGKHWEDAALGKKYSLDLERGEAWIRETASRRA